MAHTASRAPTWEGDRPELSSCTSSTAAIVAVRQRSAITLAIGGGPYGGRNVVPVITGAHLMLYSTDPVADREFLRTILGWPYVHAAGPDDPWLIFRLPPGEVGVHPTDAGPSTALSLMCDDLGATVAALATRGVIFTGEPQNQGWGIVTAFLLPGGAEIGLYQPRHATAYDA